MNQRPTIAVGRETVGIYPLLRCSAAPRRSALCLVCDPVSGSWALDALAYLDACDANGLAAAFEPSRSDRALEWVFFAGVGAGS